MGVQRYLAGPLLFLSLFGFKVKRLLSQSIIVPVGSFHLLRVGYSSYIHRREGKNEQNGPVAKKRRGEMRGTPLPQFFFPYPTLFHINEFTEVWKKDGELPDEVSPLRQENGEACLHDVLRNESSPF